MTRPSRFKEAKREQTKLRMALDGPSGSGKSYTALRFAFTLASHYGTRVAAIDSEQNRLQLYVGEAPDDVPFRFDATGLPTFSPTEYAAAIEDAAQGGYGVLVIDSLSHAWEGKDGVLELVDRKGKGGTGWKDVTPMHRRMVDAILTYPGHVIVTMRSKTDYVYEKNPDTGKTEPRKVGMAPIQRPGMEYEFDVYGSMDWSHILTITKSRCSIIDGAVMLKPGASFLAPVIRWLDTGEVATQSQLPTVRHLDPTLLGDLVATAAAAGLSPQQLADEMRKRYDVQAVDQLRDEQATETIRRLKGRAQRAASVTPTATAPVTQPVTPTTPAVHASQNSHHTNGHAPSPRMVSPDQLGQIVELRKRCFEKFGITSDVDKTGFWATALRPFSVASAKDLTDKDAANLINELRRQLAMEAPPGEPFSDGPITPAA